MTKGVQNPNGPWLVLGPASEDEIGHRSTIGYFSGPIDRVALVAVSMLPENERHYLIEIKPVHLIDATISPVTVKKAVVSTWSGDQLHWELLLDGRPARASYAEHQVTIVAGREYDQIIEDSIVAEGLAKLSDTERALLTKRGLKV